MDPIERLTRLFEKFPGIGPRQAGRFVQFLLKSSSSTRREFIDAVQQLQSGVHQCPSCMRFHAGEQKLCGICGNPQREQAQLAVVASDTDLLALERSGTYRGQYFVLGGTIHLASEQSHNLRIKELIGALRGRTASGLSEVILAFPANPEGDATAIRTREDILAALPAMRVTALGRGLSTGSELEYADPETLKSALDSRR